MTVLDEVLGRTGCADELANRPQSWEQLMTAVAAGAIDYDDIPTIVVECRNLAKHEELVPSQDAVVQAIRNINGDIDGKAGQVLIACGRAADLAAAAN